MAIADTITSMQNHTSNAYTILGYATDLTGTNKNLANLKQCIFDSIVNSMSNTTNPTWNNLPKITTTPGTSQSINNTIEAPMRISLSASELSQSGTPTPSSPQDIHTISGDNTISVFSLNWFNEALLSQEASYNTYSNGLWTTSQYNAWFLSILYQVAATTTRDISKLIPLKAGTYTIKLNDFTNNTGHSSPLTYKTFDSTGTQISSETTSQTTYSITASNDCYLDICRTNSTGTLSFSSIMIVKGTYTSETMPTYEPYNGTDYSVNLGTLGKNKFDIKAFEEQLVSGKILNDNGVEISDSSSTYSKYLIPVQANIAYYLKGAWQRMYFYDENKDFVSRTPTTNGFSRVYSPTQNGYIGFQIGNTYWASNKGTEQVEIGTSATTFEAYNPIQYCKIGNYKDRIFKNISTDEDYDSTRVDGAWYIKKNIGKVVLDGSEAYTYNSTYDGFRYINSDMNIGSVNPSEDLICSHFPITDTRGSIGGYPLIKTYSSTSDKIAFFLCDGTSDVDTFKTWLSSNNTTVYFKLATPTYTQITGTLAEQLEAIYNAMSKNGTTSISQINNDLPFILDTKVLEDLS